ncbi:MAG: hypothetical protein ACREC5_05250 [Thermoplasmata archaeon]
MAVPRIGITGRAVARSVRRSDRPALAARLLALLAALLATVGGVGFTFGGQRAIACFVMSVGFTGVLASAAWLLVARSRLPAAADPRRSAPGDPLPTMGVGRG